MNSIRPLHKTANQCPVELEQAKKSYLSKKIAAINLSKTVAMDLNSYQRPYVFLLIDSHEGARLGN